MRHSPIGMALVAPSGAWLEVNPALCALLGYSRDELIARDFQSITHPDDRRRDIERFDRALSDGRDRLGGEQRYIRKDGRTVWTELHASLVRDPDGAPRHLIFQIVDTTERRRVEEQLRLTSTPAGTAFEVLLPVSPEPAKPRTRTLPPELPRRGGHETILVVEDEPSLRRLTRALLARHGYRVLEAGSGREAIAIWDAAGERIDLVLTDLVMPDGVSGRDLASRLQRRAPDLKVILTSGHSADLAVQARDGQARRCFLAKPCSPRQLLETVRSFLDE